MYTDNFKYLMSLKFFQTPFVLIANFLSLVLGFAIADYLNFSFNWTTVILGVVFISGTHILSNLINYFLKYPKIKNIRRNRVYQFTIFGMFSFILMVLVSIYFFLKATFHFSFIFDIFFLLIIAFYSIPEITRKNIKSETINSIFFKSILISIITPSFSLICVIGEIHQFLVFFIFPIFFLTLANLMTTKLFRFGISEGQEYYIPLLETGLKKIIKLHNILVLLGWLIIAVVFFIGVSWTLVWPLLLTIPIYLAQISLLLSIESGKKPNWKFLKFVPFFSQGLFLYMLIFALLMN